MVGVSPRWDEGDPLRAKGPMARPRTSAVDKLAKPGGSHLARVARLTEGDHAVDADLLHGGASRSQVIARIELLRMLEQHLANRTGDREPIVGIDIDLANTRLDSLLNLLDRNAPGLTDLSAKLVDDVLQLLRHARAAVHHEMAVGDASVNLLDAAHRQDLTIRLTSELVGSVARADRDRQGIDSGFLDKPSGLVRIGEQRRVACDNLPTAP